MQGHGVEVVLDEVILLTHLVPDGVGRVVLHPVAEPVGFPVHQLKPVLEAEDQVDEALQETLYRVEGQPVELRRDGG